MRANILVSFCPGAHATLARAAWHTYLWMFPVYALAGLAFEPCHAAVRAWPWPLRGLLWTTACFAVEYAVGWALRRATGRCPWDYSYARWSVGGLIRLDYWPVWFGLGLLLERLHDSLVAAGFHAA